MKENINANVSEDTVTLDFLRLDGVYVSQLVDFTNVCIRDQTTFYLSNVMIQLFLVLSICKIIMHERKLILLKYS